MEATRDTAQSCSGGQAALAARLASRLADDNADSNLVLSPLSIYAALALLAAGARGATLDEILGVLGAPSRAALDEFLSRVAEDALKDHSESGGPRVAFAHGVWTDLACPLKPAYRHAAVSTYKADASTVDFRNDPEAARGQINAWVAQVTSNLIGSVLGPRSITPLTRVVLGNAMYFKGKWEKPFDKEDTANKPFHRLDGRTVEVPFMKSWSSQFIAVHEGFKVLKLRYQMTQAHGWCADRTQFSMCIFLPDAFDGLPSLVDAIASQPGFLHKHLSEEKIDVRKFRVPKFKLSFHNSLVTVLKKLGLQLPFSDQADLSDMVEGDESGLPLVLSDVIHKAVIEVNEEGTEAAASTLMHIGAGCCAMPPSPPPPVDFVADHPFAYFIVEEATGIVVFAGHVVDPSNED
ncbi:putative serpin-Z8 [Aegilops tauschii subsp. strangulata]|uniref:putative serpin-Z8 n=1 Tax=Aegilops tauschii subsp. strangulata TaxID=200361 RepID=UPI00098AAF0E|nr:putative serpin-Z8 [Aegilops tauschii subsp. strangulata]